MNNIAEVIIETQPDPDIAIIWLHGLGADGHDFAPIVRELDFSNDFAIRFIFPHAPIQPVTLNNGMEMRAWYDILGLDRNSEQDDTGIRKSEKLIQQLINQQLSQGISAKRIFIAGFSQGGAMALHTALRYPEKLAGIIALSTYLPLADLIADEIHSNNTETPIFFAHGEFDPVLPLDFAEISRDKLIALDYNVDWQVYPMAHSVCAEEITALRQWIMASLAN